MSPAHDYYLPKRRLVSQEDHSMIARPDVPRTKFSGSWTRKTTFDAGLLIPFLVDEVLPGDHLRYDVTAMVRMATPLFPLMDSQRVDTFFFFCPNRLVWSNWVRMMGEQPTGPADSIDFTTPVTVSPAGGFAVGGLYDHFGLPTAGQVTAGQTIEVNNLPARMYRLIYRDWFRDENLITFSAGDTGNGPDNQANYVLLRRAKSHDYFTSCLPWPQKFTAPTVPLIGDAPVRGIGFEAGSPPVNASGVTVIESDGAVPTYAFSAGVGSSYVAVGDIHFEGIDPVSGNQPQIFADLSAATGVQINQLRQAWMVQQLLERDARGGTRYTEVIRSHFGVMSPNMRLQRPEYIGGGSTPLDVTPIAQTAPSASLPVGALGAAGTAAGSHSASYAATEHGFIIGLINVRTELSYQQGIHRQWSRRTRYDYYWPALAQLGEQAVLRQEIYANGVDAEDGLVFGYQERWHEYRQRYSEVTGLFRSTSTGNIDEWHFAQQFTSAPVLGQTFIEDSPPMTRVLAAGALEVNKQYLADILIRREAVRPLPMFGTPALLGRF